MLSPNTKYKRSICPQCWDYSEQYQTLLALVTNVYCSLCIDKIRGVNQNYDNPLSEILQEPISINNKRLDEPLYRSKKKYNLLYINKFDGISCENDSNRKTRGRVMQSVK